jgi:phage gp46-like protein
MYGKLIIENGNGGSIVLNGGKIETTASVWTDVYIALFGGNVGEQTTTKVKKENNDWWGNDRLAGSYSWTNSQTETMLRGMTLTIPNKAKLKTTIETDLKKLKDLGNFNVDVNYTGLNRVEIIIKTQNEAKTFVYDKFTNSIILA